MMPVDKICGHFIFIVLVSLGIKLYTLVFLFLVFCIYVFLCALLPLCLFSLFTLYMALPLAPAIIPIFLQ